VQSMQKWKKWKKCYLPLIFITHVKKYLSSLMPHLSQHFTALK
jgi:hypothetical protein